MSLRPLPKSLQEKAERELNEVPSRIENDLDHLKEWISKQPYSPFKREDQWLLNHLRGCKFSLQLAKQKYALLCKIRISTEYFDNRDPLKGEIAEILKRKYIINHTSDLLYLCFPEFKVVNARNRCFRILVMLPVSSELERRRFLVQSQYADPEKVSFTALIRIATIIPDTMLLQDDACIINGQEIIIDLEQLPYGYIPQVTPLALKHLVTLLQNVYSTRLKGIYLINIPPVVHSILNVFKSFLSEKLRNRVHFYSKNQLEKLYELVPKSTLPEEYGGNAGPSDKLSNDLKLKIESYSEWFQLDSQCSLSGLDIEEFTSEIFGIEGSFRRLNID